VSLDADPQKQHRLLLESWWLWAALLLIGVILIRLVAAIGRSRLRAMRARREPRKRRQVRSAWEEAGKRVQPEPLDEPDDEPFDGPTDGDER
jgi:hypothetical protein